MKELLTYVTGWLLPLTFLGLAVAQAVEIASTWRRPPELHVIYDLRMPFGCKLPTVVVLKEAVVEHFAETNPEGHRIVPNLAIIYQRLHVAAPVRVAAASRQSLEGLGARLSGTVECRRPEARAMEPVPGTAPPAASSAAPGEPPVAEPEGMIALGSWSVEAPPPVRPLDLVAIVLNLMVAGLLWRSRRRTTPPRQRAARAADKQA